jgi:RHS repeat-associated protein
VPNQTTVGFTYSGDGLRTSKTRPDGTVTRYTWDRSGGLPLLLVEAIDAPGTTADRTVRYLYGPGGLVTADVTTPAAGADTIRWYHHDQLGSTRALTDNTGAIIATYAYTPHGEPVAATGATTPIGWAGEYRDNETGLVYLRARYYDPTTAQFLTRDPIEALTRSAYGYAGNNPINMIDPSGLWPHLPGVGDLIRGLTEAIGCGLRQLATDAGHLARGLGSFVSEHRIGIFQTISSGLLVASILLLPGFVPALAAYESWSGGLYILSIAFDVLGALEAPADQRSDRLVEIGIQGGIGAGIGSLFKASPITPPVLTRMVGAFWDVLGIFG